MTGAQSADASNAEVKLMISLPIIRFQKKICARVRIPQSAFLNTTRPFGIVALSIHAPCIFNCLNPEDEDLYRHVDGEHETNADACGCKDCICARRGYPTGHWP